MSEPLLTKRKSWPLMAIEYLAQPGDAWCRATLLVPEYRRAIYRGRLGPMTYYAIRVATSCLAYRPALRRWDVV